MSADSPDQLPDIDQASDSADLTSAKPPYQPVDLSWLIEKLHKEYGRDAPF
jgi:hypothetical protein